MLHAHSSTSPSSSNTQHGHRLPLPSPARATSASPSPARPGPLNAITDVAGVEVGYTTLIAGDGTLMVGKGPVRTGVTAILPRGRKST